MCTLAQKYGRHDGGFLHFEKPWADLIVPDSPHAFRRHRKCGARSKMSAKPVPKFEPDEGEFPCNMSTEHYEPEIHAVRRQAHDLWRVQDPRRPLSRGSTLRRALPGSRRAGRARGFTTSGSIGPNKVDSLVTDATKYPSVKAFSNVSTIASNATASVTKLIVRTVSNDIASLTAGSSPAVGRKTVSSSLPCCRRKKNAAQAPWFRPMPRQCRPG